MYIQELRLHLRYTGMNKYTNYEALASAVIKPTRTIQIIELIDEIRQNSIWCMVELTKQNKKI